MTTFILFAIAAWCALGIYASIGAWAKFNARLHKTQPYVTVGDIIFAACIGWLFGPFALLFERKWLRKRVRVLSEKKIDWNSFEGGYDGN